MNSTYGYDTLSMLAILLVSSFFITSADSATFVLGMQTSHGNRHLPGKLSFMGYRLHQYRDYILAAGRNRTKYDIAICWNYRCIAI